MNKAYVRIVFKNYPDTSTPLNDVDMNKIDLALDTIDDRVVAMDTSKADEADLLTCVSSITFNSSTGILTITLKNGTSSTIDTGLAKLAVNFDYDDDPTSAHYQQLVLEMKDGTYKYIDLSALLTQYEFKNSSTIAMTVDSDGAVSADVIDGSITGAKLQPNYLADIRVESGKAEAAATSADSDATLAESWAVGGTGTRAGEDTNNAKYWSDHAGNRSFFALDDVDGTGVQNGDVFAYDSASQKLKPTQMMSIVQIPVPTVTTYTYNGSIQTFQFDSVDTQHIIITGDSQSQAGTYVVTATLKSANDVWSDLTNAPKTFSWTIAKAQGSFSLSANSASVDVNNPTATINVSNVVGDGVISVASDDDNVATASINNGVITITGVATGTATITVTMADATNYLGTSATISVTANLYRTLTVNIDETDSNPATCCSYADDALGMTQAQIQDFLGYKPCLFINGAVDGYLNPDNYAQYSDGTSADITTLGNDVMIEFPKRGYKISTANNVVSISITDEPNKTGFSYKPFSRAAEGDRDAFYYGAYKGYVSNSMLYSTSGKQPTTSQTRANYRGFATARGTGYYQNGFYQLTYLQCCYIMQFANLNSQTAVGMGYVNSSHGDGNVNRATNTGGANAYGMNCEVIKATNPTYMTDQNHQVKCLGIEDFWGNILQWVDGFNTDLSRNMYTCFIPSKFSDSTSADGQVNQGQGATSDIGNHMSKPQGGTDTGFIAKEVSGSTTTYFCDTAYLSASCVTRFGGFWSSGADAGVFQLYVYNNSSASFATGGSRLMYV